MMSLEGKTTLITGASSGIGLAIARIAAGESRNLVLVARRGERLEALKEELSGHDIDIITVPFDLARSGAAEELVSILNEKGVVVDRLVNNKLPKQQFIDQESAVQKKKDEVTDKMNAVCAHLKAY